MSELGHPEQADLIRQCQRGNDDAFRALAECHRNLLYGTAYLMSRDHGLAEDAVQGALIQMWKHIPALRLRSSLRAWLVRIVVNEVKQQLRKQRFALVPLERAAELGDDPIELEEEIIRAEEYEYLRHLLESLPTKQKEAVILRYFADLTIPEIADVTSSRQGAVRSRLSKALNRLRDSFYPQEGGRTPNCEEIR